MWQNAHIVLPDERRVKGREAAAVLRLCVERSPTLAVKGVPDEPRRESPIGIIGGRRPQSYCDLIAAWRGEDARHGDLVTVF